MDLHTSADKPLNHPLQHEMLSPTFRWSEVNDEQIASSIEATPIQDRAQLWGKIPDDRKSGVFLVMPSSVRQHLSETITQSELNSLVEPFDAKELTAIKRSLSDEQLDIFVDKLDEHQHKLYDCIEQYTTDQVGHYADIKMLTAPINARAAYVKELVASEIPPLCTEVYLVGTDGKFASSVSILKLKEVPENTRLVDIANQHVSSLLANSSLTDAFSYFAQHDVCAMPIVDSYGKLIGRITSTQIIMRVRGFYDKLMIEI